MSSIHHRLVTLAVAITWLAALMMVGCPKPVSPPDFLEEDEIAPQDSRVAAPAAPTNTAPLVDCSVIRIQFAYDSAALSPQAQRTLDANAECIERMGYGAVTVEGHCCELGSTEYNLALGQRRAESIRSYLVDLGVSPHVVRSISYGEEKPLMTATGEENWSQNRRGEFVCESARPMAGLDDGQ